MAIDFITGPWTAIWAALEGHQEWAAAIPGNNRLKYGIGENTQLKKTLVGANDFPKAYMIPMDILDDMFMGNETFATQEPGFSPAGDEWLESITIVYVLTINSRDLKIGEADLIGVYTLQAIRRLGPRMGLPYVVSVGKVGIIQKEASRTASTYRFDFTIRIPVTMQFEGRELV